MTWVCRRLVTDTVKPAIHISTFSRPTVCLPTNSWPTTLSRQIFHMLDVHKKVLPTVAGEHTHNDYPELPRGKVVANMLATERSVCVWRALVCARPMSGSCGSLWFMQRIAFALYVRDVTFQRLLSSRFLQISIQLFNLTPASQWKVSLRHEVHAITHRRQYNVSRTRVFVWKCVRACMPLSINMCGVMWCACVPACVYAVVDNFMWMPLLNT